ncbi:MAG: AMP-binding protein [Saprospiraceae bacterium]|nr:AMP-binding protein [Saprospiraceae bacterium]
MNFIVGKDIIPHTDYKQLLDYTDDYPVCDHIVSFLNQWYDSSVLTYDFYTSGSTGSPKLIQHSREAMIASAKLTENAFNYVKGDYALLCLPVNFVAGKMMIVRAIVSSLNLIISKVKTNPFEGVLYEGKIDFAPMTPMQFELAKDHAFELLNAVRVVLLGGAPVSNKLKEETQIFDSNIFLGYGMTETLTHVALMKLNGYDRQKYFYGLENISFNKDEHDCLIIEAQHLPNKILTNDIVALFNESNFKWMGRRDNVINTGGVKVNSDELERELSRHLKENFFISSIKDDVLGSKIVIVLEGSVPSDKVNELNVIFDQLKLKNSKPRKVYGLENFIYTKTGKLDKIAMMKLIESGQYFN